MNWFGAMTYRSYGAFIASLGAAVLMLGANEIFAASGAAQGVTLAPAHPALRPSVVRLPHHRRNNIGAFWPGAADWSDGPSYREPGMDAAPPAPSMSGEMHYTYTYDAPWDAVHRLPPAVTPSARPYVPECTAESVTVPRRDGTDQTATINIMRCY
jgi:hypothetical protein